MVHIIKQGGVNVLIDCPECGKQYSDTANACPNCGYVEYEDEHITEGVLSIVIGIFAWVIAFSINNGILLLIPFIMFCISLLLEKKCLRKFAVIGFIISSSGLVVITFEII